MQNLSKKQNIYIKTRVLARSIAMWLLSFFAFLVISTPSYAMHESFTEIPCIHNIAPHMAINDTHKYSSNNIAMIGDITARRFQNFVDFGFHYFIKENVSILEMEDIVTEAIDSSPSIYIFSLGVQDFMRQTDIDTFKTCLTNLISKIRNKNANKIIFFSYNDFSFHYPDEIKTSDYDNAIKDIARKSDNVDYLDTKSFAKPEFLEDGYYYNITYYFHLMQHLNVYLNDYYGKTIRNVIIGDSRAHIIENSESSNDTDFVVVSGGGYNEFLMTLENILYRYYKNVNLMILYGINDFAPPDKMGIENYIEYINSHMDLFKFLKYNIYLSNIFEQDDNNSDLMYRLNNLKRNMLMPKRNSYLQAISNEVNIVDSYSFFHNLISDNIKISDIMPDGIHQCVEYSHLWYRYLQDAMSSNGSKRLGPI